MEEHIIELIVGIFGTIVGWIVRGRVRPSR
jgi:hypothetical protein